MRAIPKLFAAVFVLLLTMGGRAEAQTQPTEAYPIWWSPNLGLEKLDDADKYLEDPASLGGDIPLIKDDGDDRKEAIAESCGSLDRLLEKGFHAGFMMHSMRVVLYHLAKCDAIEMLLEAKPAKKSYVRDFILDSDSMDYLPAMVNPSASCDRLCRQYVANERRISWKEFAGLDSRSMKYESDYRMKGEVSGSHLTLEMLARADFNGDGLEDLLLMSHAGAVGGTWGTTNLYVLSRESPDGVLWVLDAEKGLCSKRYYQCESEYDFPEVLRRTN